MTIRKGLIYFSFIVFLFIPQISSALILYQQTGYNEHTDSFGGGANQLPWQQFNLGKVGHIGSISVMVKSDSSGTNSFKLTMQGNNSPGQGGGACGGYWQGYGYTTNTSVSLVNVVKTTSTLTDDIMTANCYYTLWFQSTSTTMQLYGNDLTNASTTEYAECSFGLNCNPTFDLRGIYDFFYVIDDGNVNSSSGQFDFNFPTDGYIFPTSLVNIDFDYYNNSTNTFYDRVGVQLVNVTDGQTLIPLETSILSSGGANFATTTYLNTGKQYYARAYMRSSTASSTSLYSSPRFFYVVSNPYPMSVLPDTVISTASSTSGVATSTISNSNNGTTTLNSINPDSVLPSDWAEMVRTRFPFSYIYDTYKLLTELAQGTSSTNASFTLPLGAIFTDPDTGLGTTTITMLDKSAITNTGYVTEIRNVISYVLYFITGLYLIGSIMSAI